MRLALLFAVLVCPAAAQDRFTAQVRVEEDTCRYTVYEVRFPSAVRSPFAANNTVWGRLYLPKKPLDGWPPPAVLALPIMAAPNVWIESQFVKALVRRGIAVLLLEMPYQFHRRPGPLMPSGQVFLARKAERLGANFRQSIADARRAITWLQRSGKVDPERIGLFGVSLGAIVSAAVYSRDDRPKAAVLLLGGADFPELAFSGEMTAEFMRRAGIRREELAAAWKGLDPLDYREDNYGKTVYLINARSDKTIPPANARKLKDAFHGAEQLWVPLGHYTSIVHLLWLPSHAARRFEKYLKKS
ncbi:MAG: alpha/beta hydrolase family protein [Elusimicrobiota bacterium]